MTSRDNWCGATPQVNEWCDDWVEFFAKHRLHKQASMIVQGHKDNQLAARVDELCNVMRERYVDFGVWWYDEWAKVAWLGREFSWACWGNFFLLSWRAFFSPLQISEPHSSHDPIWSKLQYTNVKQQRERRMILYVPYTETVRITSSSTRGRSTIYNPAQSKFLGWQITHAIRMILYLKNIAYMIAHLSTTVVLSVNSSFTLKYLTFSQWPVSFPWHYPVLSQCTVLSPWSTQFYHSGQCYFPKYVLFHSGQYCLPKIRPVSQCPELFSENP